MCYSRNKTVTLRPENLTEMGKENSERIQTSLLNAAEKRALVWMAGRMPAWVTSDMLTFLGVVGAAICALGFILAATDRNWLWLSSAGLVVNWFGDSLDGTLARVRNAQRPVYGFFIDHTLDAVTICIMRVGAGLSPMMRRDVALLVLAGYLSLSIYTYIGAILKGEFRLTYGCFGPTEFRLVVILVNTLYMYAGLADCRYQLHGFAFGLFDVVSLAVAVLLFVFYFAQFFKDKKVLAEKDPIKNVKSEK